MSDADRDKMLLLRVEDAHRKEYTPMARLAAWLADPTQRYRTTRVSVDERVAAVIAEDWEAVVATWGSQYGMFGSVAINNYLPSVIKADDEPISQPLPMSAISGTSVTVPTRQRQLRRGRPGPSDPAA